METAYEVVYIVETGLPDEQVSAIVQKYSDVVTRGGGVIDDIDRWEPRRLAYEVKERREGIYIVMNFRSEPAARDELDRIYRISDDVLRHMVIKQDDLADRFPSKARAAEQERREREMAARAAAYPPAPVAAPAPVTELAAAGTTQEEPGEVDTTDAPVLPDAAAAAEAPDAEAAETPEAAGEAPDAGAEETDTPDAPAAAEETEKVVA